MEPLPHDPFARRHLDLPFSKSSGLIQFFHDPGSAIAIDSGVGGVPEDTGDCRPLRVAPPYTTRCSVRNLDPLLPEVADDGAPAAQLEESVPDQLNNGAN